MARKVTPEEQKLWNRVAATTNIGAKEEIPSSFQKPDRTVQKPKFVVPNFEIGSSKIKTSVATTTATPKTPIDSKAILKMRRGKLSPEAKIDLHGMSYSEAHPALTRFILQAAQRNLRMVLVITGKGRQKDSDDLIPQRVGVLRQSLPQWLSKPPISTVIQGSVPAHQRHGGGGAFYVYLRRLKK